MATKPTGRPRGRPKGKGTPSKRREELRAIIEAAAPDLIDGLLTAARTGDTAAAQALLDRVVPKLKPAAMAVCVDLSGSPSEIGQRLLDAVGRGAMPVDLAHEVVSLVAKTITPQSRFEPVSEDALNAIYAEKMAAMATRDEIVKNRRAEDLLAEVKDDE